MKATLTFSSYDTAKAFARAWALFSKRGYAMSAKKPDGTATVDLDNLSPAEIEWIDTTAAALNAQDAS